MGGPTRRLRSPLRAWACSVARQRLSTPLTSAMLCGHTACAEWEAEHGAFTDEELAAARREIAEAETAARMRRSA